MLIPQPYSLFAIDLSALPPVPEGEESGADRMALVESLRSQAKRVIAWEIPDKDPFAPLLPVCVGTGALRDYAVDQDAGNLAVVVSNSRKPRPKQPPVRESREGRTEAQAHRGEELDEETPEETEVR